MMLFALAAALASGCVPIRSDRILASDVAAAIPAFASLPPNTVLGYSPRPGVQRLMQPGELMQALHRHGGKGTVSRPICLEWAVRELGEPEVRAAMLESLRSKDAAVKVLGTTPNRVPPGELSFPMSNLREEGGDGSAMWKGHLTYAPGRHVDVWARVQVAIPYVRVVAARPLQAGEKVDAASLRLESGTGLPQAPEVLTSMEGLAGATVRRTIAAGKALTPADLKGTAAVSRGEVIRVDVLSGAARISFTGTAASTADVGEYVTIQNPLNRKTLRARVTGSGRAVIGTGRETP